MKGDHMAKERFSNIQLEVLRWFADGYNDVPMLPGDMAGVFWFDPDDASKEIRNRLGLLSCLRSLARRSFLLRYERDDGSLEWYAPGPLLDKLKEEGFFDQA